MDIPICIRHTPIDLGLLSQMARDAGLERIVACAVLMASELFGTDVPVEFQAASRDDIGLARLVAASLRSVELGDDAAVRAFADLRYYLLLRSDVRFRARAVEDVLAPANWWLDMARGPVRRAARVSRSVADTFIQQHLPALARRTAGPASVRISNR